MRRLAPGERGELPPGGQKIIERLKAIERALEAGPTGEATHQTPESLSQAGPLRFDGLEDIPVISSFAKGTQSASEGQFADLISFSGDAAGAGIGLAMDPAGFLIRAGLQFLIDVIQPLEDALAYVTGHAERIDTAANKWGDVAKRLDGLAKEFRDVPAKTISEDLWSGPAATTSRARMSQFADGLDALAKEMLHLKALLGASKTLMELAQSFMIELIVTLVQWLLIVWPPAMAAAVPTGGGSVA
ncbi:WXG100 family type VII secretion target, partial [Actinomadura adrarensis]